MRVLILMTALLAGCGSEKVARRDPGDANRGTVSVEFPLAGVSADVEWKQRGSSAPVRFELRLWEVKTRAVATAVPTSFFVMKCCKSPFAAPLTARSPGVFEGQARLSAGEYWLYVQLGQGALAEKVSVDLKVE